MGIASILLNELTKVATVPVLAEAAEEEEEEDDDRIGRGDEAKDEDGERRIQEDDDDVLGWKTKKEERKAAFRLELKKTQGRFKRRGTIMLDVSVYLPTSLSYPTLYISLTHDDVMHVYVPTYRRTLLVAYLQRMKKI